MAFCSDRPSPPPLGIMHNLQLDFCTFRVLPKRNLLLYNELLRYDSWKNVAS